eukprot:7376259-Prymnesium_polylepis.1
MRCCQRAHGMLREVYTEVRPVLSAQSMTCSCGAPPSLVHTFHAEPIVAGQPSSVLPLVHNIAPHMPTAPTVAAQWVFH